MASDNAASVQSVALRVCKLDATGAPLAGAKNSYVTSAFTRFSFSSEYTAGDEIEQKGADGNVCVYFQTPDVFKRVTISLSICDPSPQLTEIIAGGTILLPTTGTDPVGYAAPTAGVNGTPNGVGFEVYSRAIVGGKQAGVNPYWRWVFPFAMMKLTGERAMENGLMANEFEGWALANPAYDEGPAGDWTYGTTKAYQFARSATAPTGINDYVVVPSP